MRGEPMYIFPAIDIIGGNVVRLTRGDYDKVNKYSITPLDAASEFCACGASHMHIVDLDGAKSGNADNAKVIEGIVKRFNMFVEVGGGIRSEEQIKKYLDCGVSRVILGTSAVKDMAFTERMVSKYGKAVSVGVDAAGGKVAVSGWKEVTNIDSLEFCRQLQNMGVRHIIYTDISKDGCLNGTNIAIYKVLCRTLQIDITASGGITYLHELQKLKKMNIYGAIVGKAIYEGKLNLAEAIAAAEGRNVG